MARPLGIKMPGGFYHVTSRGNERKEIFSGDEDRSKFLGYLPEWVSRYRLRLHGYVLMANHYHQEVRKWGLISLFFKRLS
jgi:putative transposase